MSDYQRQLNRVPVISEHDFSFRFWMKFTAALEGLRLRRVEEVYDGDGHFLGVVMRESPRDAVDHILPRASKRQSHATITCGESRANVGIGPARQVARARRKISAWPNEHDSFAVVISAGRVFQPSPA